MISPQSMRPEAKLTIYLGLEDVDVILLFPRVRGSEM